MTSILLALCFTGFGVSVNGARRWLDLGFINLQPLCDRKDCRHGRCCCKPSTVSEQSYTK